MSNSEARKREQGAKCDFCAAPATRLVGESNEMRVCGNHALGDDIDYWLSNQFMSPEMLAGKVRWWIQTTAAQAWDEGRAAERRDWEFTFDITTPDEDRQPYPNPYRKSTQ